MPMLVANVGLEHRRRAQRFQIWSRQDGLPRRICNIRHQNGKNSSPPKRAMICRSPRTSVTREALSATPCRRTVCPNRSLTSLNLSRSRQSTARLFPAVNAAIPARSAH